MRNTLPSNTKPKKKKEKKIKEGTLLEQIVRMFLGEADEDESGLAKSIDHYAYDTNRNRLQPYSTPTKATAAIDDPKRPQMTNPMSAKAADARADAGFDDSGQRKEPDDERPSTVQDIPVDPKERAKSVKPLVDQHGHGPAGHMLSTSTATLYMNLRHENTPEGHKTNMGGQGASVGESQTTEVANRMWRGDMPPPDEDEYVDQMIDAICGDPKNKQTCQDMGGPANVREWAQVAHKGAVAQNIRLKEILEAHNVLGLQPEGFPVQMQMNPEGEAFVLSALNAAKENCKNAPDPQTCRDKIDFELGRLETRDDTDTFALWVDEDGNTRCTKITNKQSLSDIRYNTTVQKRVKNLGRAAERMAAARPDRAKAILGIHASLGDIHKEAVKTSVSGNLLYNEKVSGTLSEQRGDDGKEENALDEIVTSAKTILNGSTLEPYFAKMRGAGDNSAVLRGIASRMFKDPDGNPIKWDDLNNAQLALVAERAVGISEEDIIDICKEDKIPAGECNKARGRTSTGAPHAHAGLGATGEPPEGMKPRNAGALGNGPQGVPAKLLLNVGVATAEARSKTTTRMFTMGSASSNPLKAAWNKKKKEWKGDNPEPEKGTTEHDEWKQEQAKASAKAKADILDDPEFAEDIEAALPLAAESMTEDTDTKFSSAEDLLHVYRSDNIRQLEGAKATRDETMRQAHTDIVIGHQNADLEYALKNPEQYGLPADATEEVVRQHLEDHPEDQLASRIYADTFMTEMHWADYINLERDDDIIENTGGVIVNASDYKRCLADLTGFTSDKKDGSPEHGEELITHLRDSMEFSPTSNSVAFVSGDTRVVLGHDTYRNAGDSQKLEGKAGKKLQDCLDSTKGKTQGEAFRPLLRSLIVRELDRIKNGN